MKSFLALGLLLATSGLSAQNFSCPTQEMQFSGSIKSLNNVRSNDGSVHCAYQLSFAVANQHVLCPINFTEATNAILFEEGSCEQNGLELGTYKSGVLVKQAGRFFID